MLNSSQDITKHQIQNLTLEEIAMPQMKFEIVLIFPGSNLATHVEVDCKDRA